jgi:hypothetical protein
VEGSDRSRISHRFCGAPDAGIYFEHNSCAVKAFAYSLDSSSNLASALQQNVVFPQPQGLALLS